jgi:hypothetical protein
VVTDGIERQAARIRSTRQNFGVLRFALAFTGSALIAIPASAQTTELSAPQAALYSTVSIFPPSVKSMIRALDTSHNYDCRDTTRNTTSLLLVLQQWGLLKYHVVGDPHYRGNALALQLPHNTSVLVERATRVEWVVDMWPRAYAQPPDIMTLEKWVAED